MKSLAPRFTTALAHVGAAAWALRPNRLPLLRAIGFIAAFLAGSTPLSAATLSAYVASGAGSFYDYPVTLSAMPMATDFVCASTNPVGAWVPTLGRPCNFVQFAQIPETSTIAVCDTSSGACKNQNGGIEAYVLKSTFGGAAPAPPVVEPPVSGDGSVTLNWTAPTLDTDGKPVMATGYNAYYGMNPANLAMKIALPATPLNTTISNLISGTYYFAMTAIAGGIESDRTNLASKVVTSSTSPPPVPPVPTPQPTPTPAPTPPPTVAVTEVLGTWSLKLGSSNVQTGFIDYLTCKAAAIAKATATATKYNCMPVGGSITVKLP